MTNWQLAIVVLLALLVGAFFPVLLQVRSTLRALERQLVSKRLEETLSDLHVAARGFRVLGQQLEAGERQVADVLQAVQELGQTVRGVRESVKVVSALGAALGPAVAAAIRAFQQRGDDSTGSEPAAEPAESGDPGNDVATIGRPGPGEPVEERRRAP